MRFRHDLRLDPFLDVFPEAVDTIGLLPVDDDLIRAQGGVGDQGTRFGLGTRHSDDGEIEVTVCFGHDLIALRFEGVGIGFETLHDLHLSTF